MCVGWRACGRLASLPRRAVRSGWAAEARAREAMEAEGFLTQRLPPGVARPEDLDRVWGPVYHAIVRAHPDRFQPPGRFAARPIQTAVAIFPPEGHCFPGPGVGGGGGGGDDAEGRAEDGPHITILVGMPSPRPCRLQVWVLSHAARAVL